MAVDTVPIADDEQMESLLSVHIWCQSVGILVDFVGIARLMAT